MQKLPWLGGSVLNWRRISEIITIGQFMGVAILHVIIVGVAGYCYREEKLIEQSTVLKEEIRRLERSRYTFVKALI